MIYDALAQIQTFWVHNRSAEYKGQNISTRVCGMMHIGSEWQTIYENLLVCHKLSFIDKIKWAANPPKLGYWSNSQTCLFSHRLNLILILAPAITLSPSHDRIFLGNSPWPSPQLSPGQICSLSLRVSHDIFFICPNFLRCRGNSTDHNSFPELWFLIKHTDTPLQ